MKIIQCNIWQGKLGKQFIDFLVAEKPDLVCMQEVNDLKGRAGYKFFATLDEIKDGAGFVHASMSASYASRYMERTMEYGNAILSKLPLTNTRTVFTKGKYVKNFDITKDDGNIRNLQITDANVWEEPLHILNHHGHRIRGTKQGDDETMRQMQIIAREIDKINGPLILCGDFNLSPDSPSLQILSQKLINLSTTNGLTNTYSRLSENKVVCDYIFVNDKIRVNHFGMSEELVSDHNALILDFDLA